MIDPDYGEVIQRIQDYIDNCGPEDKAVLMTILKEISSVGYSQTYENLYLSDFKEVPVSIDRFLCDPEYLGNTNDNGNMVYPEWKTVMHDIFAERTKYYEIALSGATRIGKSSTMVSSMAYMTYLLMIYRDPHRFFNKKGVSKFTIAFANLTKDLAAGVAFHEYQTTLKSSPWFDRNGRFTNSINDYRYVPNGDRIDIIPASDSSHVLGMQLWCLVGSTQILTDKGIKSLEECAGSRCNVMQLVEGDLISTQAEVLLTKYVTETIRIELEDGSIIEGTPEHMIMLSDGSYKCLGELSSSDDLLTLNDYFETSSIYHSLQGKIERVML